ncbi:SDR family NAD(P)-dependent oxidoreductase [Arthrobacter bambusae]|uniref:SDR family NAD(P)-dependent oxidoreductase n=1 Tax=Arthrobacter bambusae TaxID=1338426 RepID=UPI00278867A4|nr:SDR family oxidoreductase [Arthrobacter bambusae]MDQ0213018.1 short-subunit dehydrogenase [Arthrobacter bambusae]MDQ0237324.1 short-subunit dehydrogenase [Arthrobacter bambusae]
MNIAAKTALITGASTGIGSVFARRLAAEGARLILVARSQDKLDALAGELRGQGTEVTVLAMDLSLPDSAKELQLATDALGLKVDILVNNAGFGTHGHVLHADADRYAEQIQLNCSTLVGTSTRYLPGMVERGAGAIINIASTAAFQPIPHMAVYGATKAFVLSFTQALWAETQGTGVKVLAVCPGATDTPFFEIAGESAAAGNMRTPEQVVDTAMSAIRGNKPSVVDGRLNSLVARVAVKLLPEKLVIAVAGRAVRPAN